MINDELVNILHT